MSDAEKIKNLEEKIGDTNSLIGKFESKLKEKNDPREELKYEKELKKEQDLLLKYKTELEQLTTKPTQDSSRSEIKRLTGNFPKIESYYTERANSLKEFQTAYENNNFIAISGTGGIGKTQFAARCIEICEIPKDKIIWFECEPTSTLDAVIDFSGFPEILKGESKRDKEKVLSFIDKLDQHKLVLFLEDYHYVRKESLLNDFLKECQSKLKLGKVLILSRNDMVGISFQPKQISLNGFQNEETLLQYLSNLKSFFNLEEKYNHEELLRLCNELEGHPLAIFFALILIKKEVSINEIIDEIIALDEEENVSERLLNAIFDREDATEDEKTFIKQFSSLRGQVSKEDLKRIFSEESIKIARKLQDKNLLIIQDDYFKLHPLVREFCYRKLEDKQASHLKIGNYFISKRKKILEADLEDRIFFHLVEAQNWSELKKTIEVLGRQFIQQGFTDILQNMMDSLNSNFEELPEITSIFYGDIAEIKGKWDKALTYYEIAIQAPLPRVRVEGLIKNGEILFRKSEAIKAKIFFERALEITLQNEPELLKEKAHALNDIGLVDHFFDEHEKAIINFNKSLKIRTQINDQSGLANTYINIGNLYKAKSDYDKAVDYYQKGLALKKQIRDHLGTALSLNCLGIVFADKGDSKQAMGFNLKSLEINKEIGNQSGIATSFNSIGSVYRIQGNTIKALEFYFKSLKIYEQIGDRSGIATSFNNIGIIHSNKGENSKAKEYYLKALKIYEQIGGQSNIATSFNNIGYLYFNLKEYEKATINALKAFIIRKEIGEKYQTMILLFSDIKQRIGLEKAKMLLIKAIENLSTEEKEKLSDGTIRELLQMPQRRESPKMGLNERITVRYSSGELKVSVKYKFVKKDLEEGKCEIVRK